MLALKALEALERLEGQIHRSCFVWKHILVQVQPQLIVSIQVDKVGFFQSWSAKKLYILLQTFNGFWLVEAIRYEDFWKWTLSFTVHMLQKEPLATGNTNNSFNLMHYDWPLFYVLPSRCNGHNRALRLAVRVSRSAGRMCYWVGKLETVTTWIPNQCHKQSFSNF